MLIWKKGSITEDYYFNLTTHLPEDSLLILNDTRVIPARVLFTKPTGGIIEIFCLKPFGEDYNTAMNKKATSCWKCMIGGAGKWKSGVITKVFSIAGVDIILSAKLIDKLTDGYVTEFSWNPQYTFAEIIHVAGEIPLPPYIKRKAESEDKERYQTIYANYEGSVAAPTAGLHFTEKLLSSLNRKNIQTEFVTLHVGAGTFKPVKAERMYGHHMHAEWMDISSRAIRKIIDAGNITAVGTTTLRTVESLFWMGIKCSIDPSIDITELQIQQWEVYEEPLNGSLSECSEALNCLLTWMERNNHQRLIIPTSILIAPGYRFRIINELITNFHQPQSTLLLLVAAIAGDEWRTIYDYAMNHDFRFLSYGDGCLLFL